MTLKHIFLFYRFNQIHIAILFIAFLTSCSGDNNNQVITDNTDDELAVNISGGKLKQLYADPVRPYIYISDAGNNAVHILNITSNSIVKNIDVGSIPTKMDIDYSNQYLFVMNSGGSSVSIIDLNSQLLVNTINTPRTPDAIAVSAANILFISYENWDFPSVEGYDFSTFPAVLTYTDNSSLILVGRTSDYSTIYLHGWSTSLESTLWDVTVKSPVLINTANLSSGAATYTPIYNTNYVTITPALEYWDTRWPNDSGDVPVLNGSTKIATLNVELSAMAVASKLDGSEIAISHHESVTNSNIPYENIHTSRNDLHIFSTSNFIEIDTLITTDYIFHNGLTYASNGDIYYIKGQFGSSEIYVIDR